MWNRKKANEIGLDTFGAFQDAATFYMLQTMFGFTPSS